MVQRNFYRISLKKKRGKSFKKTFFLLWKIGIACLVFLFLFTIASFAYFAKDLPDPQKIIEGAIGESTKIYDREGETLLYEVYQGEKRTVIPFSEISGYLKKATISIEDNRFYQHPGIDFRAIVRIFWIALKSRGQKIQGASTITQQFIKNSLLTPERTLKRKIKEIILALELERRYSKDEILSFYLNQVPYGSNAYGVESAAQTFFAKPAKNLSLKESATIVALAKAPSYLSPYGSNPEALKKRIELILKKMEELGYITKIESEEALKEELKFQPQAIKIRAPHFVMYVKEYLEKKYGKDAVEKEGLRVVTTIDWKLQEKAEALVKKQAELNEKNYQAKNAALVAVDPHTGEILSMVGSRDYFDLENDGNVNVSIRPRQPGSAFKPFVYLTALKKGYTPDTLLFDIKTEFNPNCSADANAEFDQYGLRCYHPQNFDLKERGPVTMRSALAQSLNIPSVKTLYLAGVNDSIEIAQLMGISTLKDKSRYGLSLVLGGGEVTLLDITSAFGVFATEGIKNEPAFILKITNKKGEVVEQAKINPRSVFDPEHCRMINDILSDNSARAPIFGAESHLYLGSIPAAAKSGTTQEYRDGWVVGYTPEIVAGVWTGNNNNDPINRTAGVRTAGPIWQNFMLFALKDKEIKNFNPPLVEKTGKTILDGSLPQKLVKIDKITGKLATEFTPPELIEERGYPEAHTILYYVAKNNPKGPAPQNPGNDPQFKNWEETVQVWTRAPERAKDYHQVPPQEYDDVHSPENTPKIDFITPLEGSTILSLPLNIEISVAGSFPISQVDFFFDNLFLGSRLKPPYKISFNATDKNLFSGDHKITAQAYDSYLNKGKKTIFVSTNIQQNGLSLLILDPPQEKNFPYRFGLKTKGNLLNLAFYYTSFDNQAKSVFINSPLKELGLGVYEFVWDQVIAPGKYYVYVLGEDKNKNIFRSNQVLLKIPSN